MSNDANKKVEELYQEYLRGILDLVFTDAGKQEHISRTFRSLLIPDKNGLTKIKKESKDSKTGYIHYFQNEKEANNQKKDSSFWGSQNDRLQSAISVEDTDFYSGYARIKRPDSDWWNYIGTNGQEFGIHTFASYPEHSFQTASDFHGDVAIVGFYDWKRPANMQEFKRLITKNGQYVFNDDVTIDSDFANGWAVVCFSNNRYSVEGYNFVDTSGKLMNDKKYTSVTPFVNGYASVTEKNGQSYFIDIEGNRLDFAKTKNLMVNLSFIDQNGHISLRKPIDMAGYKVSHNPLKGGYVCQKSEHNKFITKYQPIKQYGYTYTLCLNHGKVYMHNRNIDENDPLNNKLLGDAHDIEYDDNFVYNNKDAKIYFMYEEQFLDITDYYCRYLKNKANIPILRNIIMLTNIYTLQEFKYLNYSEIEKILEEERQKKRQRDELEQQEDDEAKELQKLQEMKARQEEKKKALAFKKKEYERLAQQIHDELARIEEEENLTVDKTNTDERKAFYRMGDHFEIKSIIRNNLRYYDLGAMDFTNVNVQGLDFSWSNISFGMLCFNPCTVYNKDISYCTFTGVNVNKPGIRFDGVNITGAVFSLPNDQKTIQWFCNTLKNAIIDEGGKQPTINNIPLANLLSKEEGKKRGK